MSIWRVLWIIIKGKAAFYSTGCNHQRGRNSGSCASKRENLNSRSIYKQPPGGSVHPFVHNKSQTLNCYYTIKWFMSIDVLFFFQTLRSPHRICPQNPPKYIYIKWLHSQRSSWPPETPRHFYFYHHSSCIIQWDPSSLQTGVSETKWGFIYFCTADWGCCQKDGVCCSCAVVHQLLLHQLPCCRGCQPLQSRGLYSPAVIHTPFTYFTVYSSSGCRTCVHVCVFSFSDHCCRYVSHTRCNCLRAHTQRKGGTKWLITGHNLLSLSPAVSAFSIQKLLLYGESENIKFQQETVILK